MPSQLLLLLAVLEVSLGRWALLRYQSDGRLRQVLVVPLDTSWVVKLEEVFVVEPIPGRFLMKMAVLVCNDSTTFYTLFKRLDRTMLHHDVVGFREIFRDYWGRIICLSVVDGREEPKLGLFGRWNVWLVTIVGLKFLRWEHVLWL